MGEVPDDTWDEVGAFAASGTSGTLPVLRAYVTISRIMTRALSMVGFGIDVLRPHRGLCPGGRFWLVSRRGVHSGLTRPSQQKSESPHRLSTGSSGSHFRKATSPRIESSSGVLNPTGSQCLVEYKSQSNTNAQQTSTRPVACASGMELILV